MKTLVVGLGNPILTDDGIGPKVAEELQSLVDPLQADNPGVQYGRPEHAGPASRL